MCLNQKELKILYQIFMQHFVIINDQSMTIEELNISRIACL